MYSMSGEEDPDMLMNLIMELSGGQADELEEMIMSIMGGVDRFTNPLQTRRFRQLKVIVLWLQKEQQFGRYCYYGCYCLPEGSHNIAAGGYGQPQDDIDRSCKRFKG